MRKPRLSADTYIQGVLSGDRTLLSRAITLAESQHPDDRLLANEICEKCLPHSGKAVRIGITGAPGAGKSTFIESFGLMLVRRGLKLAVLAIDPSSSLTHGSILGDKTRMEQLSMHPSAYIRPSASGGSLGGVTRKTREAMILCEAAGFDVILVETVGVGQSETAVQGMTDFFLLLLLPNAGDELQGIKKGIMEMADGIVINKADGALMDKARMTGAMYSQALRLFPVAESGWQPRVTLCSALERSGMEEVWESIGAYLSHVRTHGWFDEKRKQQEVRWLMDTLRDHLEQLFFHNPLTEKLLSEMTEAVSRKEITAPVAAARLIRRWQEVFQAYTPSSSDSD